MARNLLALTALVGLLASWAGCGTDHEPLGPSGSSKQPASTAVAAKLPVGVRVLIAFRDLPDAALVRRAGGNVRYAYQIVPAIAATLPQVAVDRLRSHPAVALIEPDAQMWAIDAELDQTWGVDRIDAEIVHAGGNTGSGIRVAIIDTGIDYLHPELDDNYAGGSDFVNGDADPMDDHGHGTHVAGTVAAEDNGIGVVGTAPGAQLYALKVLGYDGSGLLQ